jgi:hypothetical protein
LDSSFQRIGSQGTEGRGQIFLKPAGRGEKQSICQGKARTDRARAKDNDAFFPEEVGARHAGQTWRGISWGGKGGGKAKNPGRSNKEVGNPGWANGRENKGVIRR